MRMFYFHPTVIANSRNKKKSLIKRRATVAAIAVPVEETGGEGNELGPLAFHFGMSVCSEKDQFRKAYGRASAMGKAQSKNPTAINTPEEPFDSQAEMNVYFVNAAKELLSQHGYTVWVDPVVALRRQAKRKRQAEKRAAKEAATTVNQYNYDSI